MTTAESRPDHLSRLAPLLWAGLALLLASATPSPGGEAAAPGGVRLLWFTSANCGPCQQIRPHVERMAAERLPVFKVDTAVRPDVMQRYGVTGVPTFVLEAGGREVWRGVGVPGGDARGTADRMRSRLTRALADARKAVRSQSPARRDPAAPASRAKTAEIPLTLISDGESPPKKKRGFLDFFKRDEPANEPRTIDDPFAAADPAPAAAAAEAFPLFNPAPASSGGDAPPANPAADPMRTVVRLQVSDAGGTDFGSGTVIASRPGRSIVLTCAHVLKNCGDAGRIRAESFAGGSPAAFEGTIIGLDSAADVGLIALDTPSTLPASALSPNVLVVGDRVVSTGCDGGDAPTRQNHVVQSVGKFAGPSNFTCTGQPRRGRSGGGCFDAAGRVVGVVWSVSKDPPEGIYAGLPAVFDLLDRHGLTALKPGPAPSAGAPSFAAAEADPMMDELFADADPAPTVTPAPAPPAAARQATAGGAVEITCVIRSTEDPSAPSEILVINRATARTLALLRGAATGEPTPTSLHVAAAPPAVATAARRRKRRGGAAPRSVCRPAAARR